MYSLSWLILLLPLAGFLGLSWFGKRFPRLLGGWFACATVGGAFMVTLLMLAQKNGSKLQIEGVTHAELAEMIGASREMVSIILKDLKLGDYIRVDGRVITLLKEFPEKR